MAQSGSGLSQTAHTTHSSPLTHLPLTVEEGSVFCYLEDNHTSVVGMREVALSCGAGVVCVEPSAVTSSGGSGQSEHPTCSHVVL